MPPFTADSEDCSDSVRCFGEELVAYVGPVGHWLVLGAGMSLMFVSELVFFIYGSSNSLIRILELALPMVVGIGLVWYGFQLRDHEFTSWQIAVLGIAVLLGMGLFVVLATYMQVLLTLDQGVPQEPIYLLLNAMAFGAVINFVYAYQYLKLKAEVNRLESRVDRLVTILSRVSHDLRNPLNVAQGYADMLADDLGSSSGAGTLRNSLDRIDSLIDELVVFAHSNNAAEHEQMLSLEALAHDSWSMVETESAVFIVEADRRVRADPDRLQHLFENLFRNAIVHGGGEVTVTVGTLADGFFVSDDGPGIPPEECETVFEAGYTTADDGTGLGLNIVAEIVEGHDWDIVVTESETGGARFEITGVEFD